MYRSTAFTLARQAHEGQTYGSHPYFPFHVYGVAVIAEELAELRGMDVTEVSIVALLHDVVEDTEVTIEDLRSLKFTERVLEAVEAITKVPEDTFEGYYSRVRSSELATLVKTADLLFNLTQSTKAGNVRRIWKYTEGLRLLNPERGKE